MFVGSLLCMLDWCLREVCVIYSLWDVQFFEVLMKFVGVGLVSTIKCWLVIG